MAHSSLARWRVVGRVAAMAMGERFGHLVLLTGAGVKQ